MMRYGIFSMRWASASRGSVLFWNSNKHRDRLGKFPACG